MTVLRQESLPHSHHSAQRHCITGWVKHARRTETIGSVIRRCLEATEQGKFYRPRRAFKHRKQPVLSSSAPTGKTVRLPRRPEEELPKDTIEQVILRRGSTRMFDKTASVTLAQLSTTLNYATRRLPADFLESPGAQQKTSTKERSSTELRFASFSRSIVRDPGRLSRVPDERPTGALDSPPGSKRRRVPIFRLTRPMTS